MKHIALCISLLFFLPGLTYGAPALKAEITIEPASLKTELYRQGHVFFIDARITNTSTALQEIIIWTQRGWSWTSSISQIAAGEEALKNYPASLRLKPGESYAGAVEMFSFSQQKSPLRFRLGFLPQSTRPAERRSDPALHPEFVWSNEVTFVP